MQAINHIHLNWLCTSRYGGANNLAVGKIGRPGEEEEDSP